MKQQHIVVVQAGWVFVGEIEATETAILMTSAYNIRIWGTTRGLGQLALEGTTKDTVLDLYGNIDIPKAAVLMLIECHTEIK